MKKLSKGIFCLVVILMGVITINFLNTNNKNLKEVKINDKRLAVFIRQEDGSYKTETQIPQVGYTLNIDKSTCSNGAKPTWSNNTLNLSDLTTEDTNCYLYFDEDMATKKLKEMGLTSNTETPDFSQVATTDEGIFAAEDGMYGGTSYYWRGAVTTNYLRFAGYCWRIIRINGDGSLRLIYDGTTCHENGTSTEESIAVSNVAYNTNYDRSEYVGWTYEIGKQRPDNNLTGTASNAKTQTDNWYNTNIGNNATYASKVADGKYCNDRKVDSVLSSWGSEYATTWSTNGTKFAYASVKRLYETYMPTLSCNPRDVYTLKAGAIMADEVEFAVGKPTPNNNHYLRNGYYYWTMTPSDWTDSARMIYIQLNGFMTSVGANAIASIRPVINLRSEVSLTGNGTITNPFVVEGAE